MHKSTSVTSSRRGMWGAGCDPDPAQNRALPESCQPDPPGTAQRAPAAASHTFPAGGSATNGQSSSTPARCTQSAPIRYPVVAGATTEPGDTCNTSLRLAISYDDLENPRTPRCRRAIDSKASRANIDRSPPFHLNVDGAHAKPISDRLTVTCHRNATHIPGA
jgi:hypothetical protein